MLVLSISKNVRVKSEVPSDNQIWTKMQFCSYHSTTTLGFRSKHSTIDAITTLPSDILERFECNKYILAVFCDLSKAFDALDHNILIYKFYKYGIRGQMFNLLMLPFGSQYVSYQL